MTCEFQIGPVSRCSLTPEPGSSFCRKHSPCYPVPGSNRTPIAKHKVAGQPILPPPTIEDVERIRKMLDARYGKEIS